MGTHTDIHALHFGGGAIDDESFAYEQKPDDRDGDEQFEFQHLSNQASIQKKDSGVSSKNDTDVSQIENI